MNLIELQDKLRSMPAQVLQQYANGMNPEVPPWLALSVLQQKQMDAQRMGVAQGAAMGQMPTVKDKVEQSSGLMALQQQKQQQAAAQAAEQNAQKPSPVPGGVPAAERQPEAGMRSGGIVGLPTGLKLAGGGIVSFAEGDSVELRQIMTEIKRRNPEMSEEQVRRMAVNQMQRYDEQGKFVPYYQRENRPKAYPGGDRSQQKQFTWEDELANDVEMAQTGSGAYQSGKSAFGSIGSGIASLFKNQDVENARASGARLGVQADQPDEVGPEADMPVLPSQKPTQAAAPVPSAEAGVPQKKPAGLPGAAPNLPPAMPARERPDTTLPAVAPAAPAAPEKTPAQLAMEMQQGVGYGANYGKDREALSKQMAGRYEQYKQGRGLDDLIRVLSGAGRGYGGQAAAYLENRQRGFSEDAAEQQRQMNLLKELESGRQEQGKALFQGATEIGKQQMAGTQGMAREQLSQAAQNARAQLQANISMYGADRVYDAAMAQVAAANKRADVQERRAVIDGIKAQMNALTTELKGLPAFGKDSKERRVELQRQIDDLRRALRDSGEGGPAAPTGGGGLSPEILAMITAEVARRGGK